jgi:hypothetical protein
VGWGRSAPFCINEPKKVGARSEAKTYLQLNRNFQSEDESEGWRGEGIHLEPVEPLKQWTVRFQARNLPFSPILQELFSLFATYVLYLHFLFNWMKDSHIFT